MKRHLRHGPVQLLHILDHIREAAEAPLIVVYVMSGERARRLGALAERFSAMEVGFAAQNLYLQAASLGLGTTFMAGFNDSAMTRVLPAGERALGIMPVGQPR